MSPLQFLLFSFLALVSSTAPLRAEEPRPSILAAVGDLALETRASGLQPVAVFDLDDTLINTRERTLRILQDFIRLEQIRKAYPEITAQLASLQVSDIHFQLSDTLASGGVTDPAFVKEATLFWSGHFFTNEYCANDSQMPGAAAYVRSLARLGVRIVYLTGRDVPRMQAGTIHNLKALGFPLGASTEILMKPDPKMDDLEFKKKAFDNIRLLGSVVGVFENEPANINALHQAFPEAISIFVDSTHSPKPDQPEPGISWILDFQYTIDSVYISDLTQAQSILFN